MRRFHRERPHVRPLVAPYFTGNLWLCHQDQCELVRLQGYTIKGSSVTLQVPEVLFYPAPDPFTKTPLIWSAPTSGLNIL
ncbi:unnamed protein product [Lota lota]